MQVSIRFPGTRASDPRVTVTVQEPGTPWPLLFHFLRLEDADTGEQTRVNVGFAIGADYTDSETLDETPAPLDPVTVQRIAASFGAYLSLAEQFLAVHEGGRERAIELLRGPGRKPARLTDDFYRLVAADYEARKASGASAPLQQLADANHVDKSTASKWIKTAREKGYLDG